MTKTLMTLLSMSTNDLAKQLSKKTEYTDGKSNYFFFPGSSNILLMAHIDTVNKYDYRPRPVKLSDKIINQDKYPVGGDDRVGVYYCLKYHFDRGVNVLLTNHEETGGAGMAKFIQDLPSLGYLKDIDLIVTVDRAGVGHYVAYDLLPEWVDPFLADNGLIDRQGSWSDCQMLTDATDIPSVNVACGYYGNHTRMEVIDIADFKKTKVYLDAILQTAGEILDYKLDWGETIVDEFAEDIWDYRHKTDSKLANGYHVYDTWYDHVPAAKRRVKKIAGGVKKINKAKKNKVIKRSGVKPKDPAPKQ